MYALTTKGMTNDQAMNAIFDACRANEKREDKGLVSFRASGLLEKGEFFATLRNTDGAIVATAVVDKFDC